MCVVSSMILCALIPWDLVCVIPWDLVCAVDHIVDDDDWRCALLISSSRSLDMLKLVRTSASHHSPTMGISQKKQRRKVVAEKRVVSMEQRRCSRKTIKKRR